MPVIPARTLAQLGLAVRRVRDRRGLSQAELAARAGVSRQWVIAVEQGRTNGLEVGLLMRVLDALDASLTVRDDLDEGPRG
ncbi:helix-turn-helix transcriptional regulator [Cellulomonas sp. GbtcB1]|uniref:helix-turn-helix transcriptional regulator n=1 Tax=Cellulomonas sp. GbtcB1 TaxID=2824746 RepID=UPI001C3005BC|nr:helix-turn-helix domain-containing protein [Cellulomonas sp. GbtcB1]